MALAKNLAFYMNGVSLSCALQSFDASAETETLDATTLCQTARTYATGLSTGTVSASGLWDFDSTDVNKIHNAFESAYTNGTNNVVTATLQTLAHGADAILFNATQTSYNVENATGQLITASADFQTQTGIGFGKILFAGDVLNTTTNGTSVDGGASSTGGALFQVHAVNPSEVSGDVKFQHSSNNSTWADLTTINLTGAGKKFEAFSYEVARGVTLNRYVRAVLTAGANTITFVAAVARR